MIVRDDVVAGVGGAVAGGCIATASEAPHLGLIAASAAAGAVFAALLARGTTQQPTSVSKQIAHFEQLVPLCLLIFLVPLLTQPLAPGADMAMHVALARPMSLGGDGLSPAWGPAHIAAYPRGFSAWVAIFSVWFGLGKASIVTSALAFSVYFMGLATFLGRACRAPNPNTIAAFFLLGSRTPQSYYGWGGSPTALALGLGLLAAGELAAADGGEQRVRVRAALLAALLLIGAMWTHPIGACVGTAVCVAVVAYRARGRLRARASEAAIAFLPVAIVMLWLQRHGPVVSPRELEWIRHWQDFNENALGSAPKPLSPITVWWAVATKVGPVVGVTFLLAAFVEWKTQVGRRRLFAAMAIVSAIGLVLAYGPRLPAVGFLVYTSRILPLTAIALAPTVAYAFDTLCSSHEQSVRSALSFVAVVSALVYHTAVYQRAVPIATQNDIRAAECVARVTPRDAVIEGAYGDATQWLPALTGRLSTNPHIHCTMFDEVEPYVDSQHAKYRFVGERMRYEGKKLGPPPRGKPLCSYGGAALYLIEEQQAPTSDQDEHS